MARIMESNTSPNDPSLGCLAMHEINPKSIEKAETQGGLMDYGECYQMQMTTGIL